MTAPQRINYLARRHPRFTRDEWIPVWRAHWALAESQPQSSTVRRYIQCEVLFDQAPIPQHAVASAEYFSPESRLANRTATGYHAIMRADEERVFERVISECSFIANHHVLAGSGTGPFKVVRFLRHRPGFISTVESSLGAWIKWAARAGDLSSELLGYAQNHAIEPELPDGWGLDVDGSEEYWFDDPATAREFLRSDILTEATNAAPFVVIGAVVTNEVILKDAR